MGRVGVKVKTGFQVSDFYKNRGDFGLFLIILRGARELPFFLV